VLEEVAAATHRRGVSIPVDELRSQSARLAPCLVGLTRSTSRDMLRDGLSGETASFTDLHARLFEAKKAHLSRELAMTVLDTGGAEDPIGLDYLVEYLVATRERAVLEGPDRARGVLLAGPPGTGKTMLARSLGGRVLRLPVVEFRVSSLMNSLLGETERRFAAAFATMAAMAPNVVFIDEVEKAFGDSSERDGGTMMRCTGALLSWLSDNPAPNYIVATANDIRRMGQIGMTMTRSERFDAAFFVDVPGRAARCRMLERWLGGQVDDPADVAGELAGITQQFSGADLRSVIKKAAAQAEHRGSALTVDGLRDQVERKRSRVIALYDEFQPLRRWGRLHCEPAGPSDD
jgi:SpoVK/Ycf46/Vps4 family AAA+-type ATPase